MGVLLTTVVGVVVAIVAVLILAAGALWYRSKRRDLELNKGEAPKDYDFSEIENNSTRSPSPPRSMTSMDSSRFTFNPESQASQSQTKSGRTKETFGSSLQTDVTDSINVEAWRNSKIGSGNPAPFGNDISAIDGEGSPNKTIPLLDMDDSRTSNEPLSHITETTGESGEAMSDSYLCKDNLSKLSRSKGSVGSKKKSQSGDDNSKENDESDVLNDLMI